MHVKMKATKLRLLSKWADELGIKVEGVKLPPPSLTRDEIHRIEELLATGEQVICYRRGSRVHVYTTTTYGKLKNMAHHARQAKHTGTLVTA